MKLDLSEIARTTGMRATQEVDEPCLPEDFGLDCASPVKGRIRIANAGILLLVEGNVGTDIRLTCSRCLTEFVVPVEAEIKEQFRIVQTQDAYVVLPMDEDEVSSGIVTNNILDLDELIRQNLLVALPIQPLCNRDCKGLCPTCGRNLNEGPCACPPDVSESPFEVLADLLKENEE